MPTRSSKDKPTRPRNADVNQLARFITDAATSDEPPADAVRPAPDEPQKNPAAVALGRLGGAKGGKARAASLSKKKRSEIAKKAAKARWGKAER